MSEDGTTDLVNPWDEAGRVLTNAEITEIELFQKQERLAIERKRRQGEFDLKQLQERAAFAESEYRRHSKILQRFEDQMFSQGIEQTRQRIVPAYTFTRFLELPTELQLKIWTITSHTGARRVHSLICMNCDNGEDYRHTYKGSSRVKFRKDTWHPQPFPIALHVCRSSRAEALNIYANISPFSGYHDRKKSRTYINTLLSRFYMGVHPWNEFKILIDSLIKLNTTRPLQEAVRLDLEGLRNIRLLTVDLNIFGAAPVRLWAEAFPKLENLTIAFYPFPVIRDHEMSPKDCGADDRDIQFITPQRGTKHGKRADWIVKSAFEALKATEKSVPDWKIPKLEAVVRLTDNEDLNYEVIEAWTEDEISDDEDEDEEQADDSTWYEQAATRMSYPTLPTEQIKRFKHKYHPSRKVGLMDNVWKQTTKYSYGEYYTDSEHEGGSNKRMSDWDDGETWDWR